MTGRFFVFSLRIAAIIAFYESNNAVFS